MAVYLIAMVSSVVVHIPRYINAHPVAELASARYLEQEFGRGIKVAGTFRFTQRYVGYDYTYLEDAHGPDRGNDGLYFEKIKSSLEKNDVDYIIVGRLNLGNRPGSLLECGEVPPFLSCIREEDGVLVYKVNRQSGRK
jgi:hypothetical protein